MKIGLMLETERASFLICKDPNGYPDLVCLSGVPPQETKKESAKQLYLELTGTSYPLSGATTRQVLWDLLEAALKQLP
jgi:hypothetical protein